MGVALVERLVGFRRSKEIVPPPSRVIEFLGGGWTHKLTEFGDVYTLSPDHATPARNIEFFLSPSGVSIVAHRADGKIMRVSAGEVKNVRLLTDAKRGPRSMTKRIEVETPDGVVILWKNLEVEIAANQNGYLPLNAMTNFGDFIGVTYPSPKSQTAPTE